MIDRRFLAGFAAMLLALSAAVLVNDRPPTEQP